MNDITIVYVDGREQISASGIFALEESMQQLPKARGLLLSPVKPDKLPDYIEHKTIPKLGYFEYSLFMVYGLHEYIDTEYVITVQSDGWILNGNSWCDDFLNYDFIGAPLHIARVNGDVYHGFMWTNITGHTENVFNGGFSLRSKTFLEAPARYQIPFIISAPIGTVKGPKLFLWEDECNQEDVQLCLYMRKELENKGIKFPDLNIAKQFSFEHLTPLLHETYDIEKVFGHHASMRKLAYPKRIDYNVDYHTVKEIYGEMKILITLSKYGYTFSFPDE